MRHSGCLLLFTACTYSVLGFVFGEPTVLKTLITRQTKFTSKSSESEKPRDVLMEKTSLKAEEIDEKEEMRVRTGFGSNFYRSRSASRSGLPTASPDFDSYLNLLSGLYHTSQPILMDGFLQALVCVLANGTQCGWQADLTTTLVSKLGGPLMSFLSSIKSQTCPLNTFQRSEDPAGAQSQLTALHELLSAALSLRLSENFWTGWNTFIDLSLSPLMSDISCFMVDLFQSLVELVTVGLQFGIEAPTLNQTQLCPQGDLKQLLIWGIRQNLNWSFGDSILNMFLTLDVPPCSYTDAACQSAYNIQSLRSMASTVDDPLTPLNCDVQDVTQLNYTLCAEIIASRSQIPDALYYVCESLSTLTHSELTQVWRNTCHMVEFVLLPLLEPCPPSPSESSQRVARSTLSLSQLFCNYANWMSEDIIDPGLVTMCSDNDPEAFLEGVCNNAPVMQALIENPSNSWVWEYCANVSDKYMVWQYCVYDQWTLQTLDPSIVALCWNNDQARMEKLLCQNIDFYIMIFSIKDNIWIMPNCTEVPTSPPNDIDILVSERCRYSEWRNLMTISPDHISLCIQNDEPQFVSEVCANTSFLTGLVVNKDNEWVLLYCTLYLKNSSTVPPVVSSIPISPATPLISITSSSDSPTKTPTVATLFSTTLSPSLVPATPSIFTTVSPTTPLTLKSAVSSSVDLSPSTILPVSSSKASSSSSSPNVILFSTSPFPILLSPSPLSSMKIPTASNLTFSSTLTTLTTTVSPTVTITRLPIINPTLSNSVLSTISPTSTTLLTTTPPTVRPTIPSMSDLCKYSSWVLLPVHPSVIGLCWKFDMIAFNINVCCNMTLLAHLTVDPQNQWLKSVCSDNDTSDLLPKVCLYSEWTKPVIVDMTDLALCADLDKANFVQKVCANATILQNLLVNLDNTWLLEQCSNLTGSGKENLMGFKPSQQCRYANWTVTLPDAALLALCWDYDQANFISSICVKPAMLSYIVQDPSNLWVSTLCATCSNYTRVAQFNTTTNSSSSNTNTTELHPCLVKEMIIRLNWSCNIDLNAICQPDIPHLQVFQAFLRCGVEVLLPRLEKTMTTEVATMIRQSTSLWVVLLLVLEENGVTTLRVTDNIGQSVLDSVSAFLEKETSFNKKQVLLQCFAKVLTGLMQTGRDVTSDASYFIKQYFQIPLVSQRAVLSSVDMNTMRLILQYYNRNQENLQLTEDYLRTMVSVLMQIHLRQDEALFFDLGPLLSLANPADIRSLPPLQNNIIVLNLINNTISSLSPEQRQAFGTWFSQSLSKANVTAGSPSFIRDCGNLIAYLPFRSFQYLSPVQVLNGLDVLLRNDLGAVKQQFVAQSVIGVYKNLTAEQFRRLGTLACQANVNDLLAYVNTSMLPVIQENVRTCISQGTSIPSNMISSVLFSNMSELQSPAALSPQKVSQLAPLLPLLGAEFLEQLSQSQLVPVFSALTSVPFTPTQAAVIIDKISSSVNFDAVTLAKLGSLLSGLRAETLSTLSSNVLLSALSNFSQYTPELTPPQVNAITTQLWAAPAVVTWLDEAEPLLSGTPLLCVMSQARRLLTDSADPYTHTWNTQQAKTLFNEVMSGVSSLTAQRFMSLGTVAAGVSCNVLTKLFQNSISMSSMRDLLHVLREQPGLLHSSLKRCLIEEMYKSNFFSELLGDMGAQVSVSIPMSMIKKFSTAMMDSLRRMIILDPQYFLLMPRIKQAMLVDKMVQSLGLNTGTFTEVEFRSLGIMATIVADAVFMQLDRRFFVDSIEFLRGFCYDTGKRDMVASMLQEAGTFGPVQRWNTTTLIQVDRFLFFLPQEIIQLIPPVLMSLERIERLFISQQQWESGDVGSLCEHGDNDALLSKKQFVLQYFSGVLKPGRSSLSGSSAPPSCESVQVTGPAVWPLINLLNMSSPDFRQCLELIGQDPSLTSDQLSLLLRKTKEVYGVVSTFTPSIIAQLGHIATQLSLDELPSLKLSEILSIAPLGAVSTWTRKQLAVLFSTVLNFTKQTPSQLNSTSLVALGHIVCGIEAPVIATLNPVEFSKAVLWLGRLNVSCSEDQLQAVVSLLSSSLAFGPVSSWGPEVFLEIGAFAAGIPDMALSSLVKEQIEGITPLAISLITAKKFAVVFNQVQISVFSYEQATAVTAAQRSALSPVQQIALSMVLNLLEDKPVDFRGRSLGVTAEVCPFCHVCSLLVFILTLLLSDRP